VKPRGTLARGLRSRHVGRRDQYVSRARILPPSALTLAIDVCYRRAELTLVHDAQMTLRDSLTLARLRLHAWSWHRAQAARQRPAAPLKFSGAAGRKMLLVSLADAISQSQTYPFHFYSDVLRHRWGYELLEIGLDALQKTPEFAPKNADLVCFQAWIDKSAEELQAIVTLLRAHHPKAKLVFLDPCAPTDLRFAKAIGASVDLYVKKHLLRDLADYDLATRGDTNLTDWYGKHFDLDMTSVHFELPPGFKEKLVLGPSFVTAPYMLPRFFAISKAPVDGPRRHDVHARLGGVGDRNWYEKMRALALEKVNALRNVTVTPQTFIGKRAYMRELAQSRICFSPFGYGEVCWRDYEAVFCGALLIKPDMSHMATAPDVFVPNVTYVPIRWDFADLGDAVEAAMSNESRRLQIARQAYEAMHLYARSNRFVDQLERVFDPAS
jgi:hypothetical protein